MTEYKSYCPAQLSIHIRRNDMGQLLERSTMVNLRGETAAECYRLFEELKAKLGKELGGDASPVSMDETAPIHFPDESVPCEDCGGRLVPRVAKNGKNAGQRFFGCVNFPQCHYTQAIA